ncbi:MAG: asparagine synthase (glutamine-hydrolyzing) [Gammaproteobacteria bacterium]
MCGIFFSIGFENLPPSVIDSVIHRGPDGRGWNEFSSPVGPVIIAHRRLAIVDLSIDGHQPMSSDDGRYWVTYNGEIYNYLEIRKELEKLGHHFRTKTDTEVLLKSYLEWGEDCLNNFNGMFAFVIWDDKEKQVFAARDRFGVKPFYLYQQGKKIAFASEIKQFKHLPDWVGILNKEMGDEYLHTGYCDHKKETLYNNVLQLLSGKYLTFNAINNSIKFVRWYDLKSRICSKNISDEEAISTFKSLFIDAIRLRLRSDVSVGACLSGGLDSSSIVSMIREIQGPTKEIYTFSSVFPGHKEDESTYIDELALRKNLTSNKNYSSLDECLIKISEILFHQDLPFSGTSVFAQWKTFENAKNVGITVLLDGQGADESLLGYPGMLNGIIFYYLKKLDFLNLFKFVKWQTKYNNQVPKTTFLLGLQQKFPQVYIALLKVFKKNPCEDKISVGSSLTDICLQHFLNNLQTLLRYEDRNSMAFSRESRLPFLDYRLVEFIFSLPINKRFRNTKTKWILREAMKGLNTDSVLNRRDKIGFATPENDWLMQIKNNPNCLIKDCNLNFHQFIFNFWLNEQKISY